MVWLAPSNISDLISVRSTTGRYNLRTSNGLTLKYSSCKSLATLGDRSFHVTAPKLWNDLPGSVRNIKSVNSCKKILKIYLFLLRLFENLSRLVFNFSIFYHYLLS